MDLVTARERDRPIPMPVSSEPVVATELAARLRLIVVRLSRQLRRHDPSGLSPALVSALGVVGRRGPLTPSELAEVEDVKRPTATRFIAILEDHGLVDRERDPCDGRSYRVAATARGRALLAASRTARNAYLARGLATLEPGELESVDRALVVLERLVREAR
jgi:DNA-binding MarR family transcriptional regulator